MSMRIHSCASPSPGRTMEEIRRAGTPPTAPTWSRCASTRVDRPDVAGALEGRRAPGHRHLPRRLGGRAFAGSEEERRRILESAVARGAEFVDVEARASFAPDLMRRARRPRHRRLVALFGEPPSDLRERWAGAALDRRRSRQARGRGAALDRHAAAVRPRGAAAADEPRPRARPASRWESRAWPSRVLAARLGNRWTYAGDGVAPGQLPAARLLEEFRFRRITPDAALYGVVGNPIIAFAVAGDAQRRASRRSG